MRSDIELQVRVVTVSDDWANYDLPPGPAEGIGWRGGPRLNLLGQFTAGCCWKQTAQTCLNEHDEG